MCSCTCIRYAENSIPGDMEQATGLEKKELEALMQGKEVIPINAHLTKTSPLHVCMCAYTHTPQDPFNMSVNTGPRGTRDKPTLVPSMFDERIVGCICKSGVMCHSFPLLFSLPTFFPPSLSLSLLPSL